MSLGGAARVVRCEAANVEIPPFERTPDSMLQLAAADVTVTVARASRGT